MKQNKTINFPKLMKIGYCGDFPIEIPLYLSNGVVFETNQYNRLLINQQIQLNVINLLKTVDFSCLRISVVDFALEFEYLNTLKQENDIINFVHKQDELKKLFAKLDETKIHLLKNVLQPGQSLFEYNKTAQYIEPYHFIIINDFAKYLTDDDLQSIITLAETSKRHNIYFVLTVNPENIIKRLNNSFNNRFSELLNFFIHSTILIRFSQQNKFEILNIPSGEYINRLMHQFNFEQFIRERVLIDIADINKELDTTFDDGRENFISIPIGKCGRNTVSFELGEKSMVFHGLIAGMNRTGKSNLLNNIITQIAEKYTSNEVQLFLLDYKFGTEFKIFRNHPNSSKLLLNNEDYQCAIDILRYFHSQMQERETLFGASINKIEEYNQKSKQKLPHLLLIIDEVQTIFKTGNYNLKKEFNRYLSEIARKGAGYGLHLLFASQTFAGIDWAVDIKSQMPLRIAFRLASNSDIFAIFDGQSSNETLKLPRFNAIYNTNCGEQTSNIIVHLDECNRESIERRLRQVRDRRKPNELITPEIIAGNISYKTNEENINFTDDNSDTFDDAFDDLENAVK